MHPLRTLALGLMAASSLQAADLRLTPAGQLPHDSRLGPLKELNGYFPFTPSPTPQAWVQRAERVRRQMLVSLGLWPLPDKTPLHAVIHGRIDRGDYTVEKVYFESMPGFFVTGNLYRPKDAAGKHPVVLCPYGHWPNGRFMDADEKERKKQFDLGAEEYEDAAHSPLQARCVNLARMGCVVFHYDMIGRSDSLQIPETISHSFAKQRAEMISPEKWGFFSPQAESHFQSIMGLQTWDSIRAIDFVTTLPDVDPTRIGVTGASGGATQTMIVAPLDSRVTAAFPAVMVSTAMQGGCTCENASGLRVGTGNIEFAALFAPKPMAMSAANDWTKEMPTKGFPELQKHWAMLGAPDKVQLNAHLEFPHNYNAVIRGTMYAWFNKYLGLNLCDDHLRERDFSRLTTEEMSVWNAEHPAPPGGPSFELSLLQSWRADAEKKITGSPKDFRKIAGPAVEVVVGRTPAETGEVVSELKDKIDRGNHYFLTGLIHNQTHDESLPAIYFHPKKWNGATVLWLDEQGKAGLLAPDAAGEPNPRPEIKALVDAGISVIGVDLLYQGEFLPAGGVLTRTRLSKNPRQVPAYTFGYNYSVFAERVQDVLSVRQMVAQNAHHHTQTFALVGFGAMGPIAAAARAVAPGLVDAAVIESGGFRFLNVSDMQDPSFLPGGAKYGDLPGMLALGAPKRLLLAGEKEMPPLTAAVYAAEGAEAGAAEARAEVKPAAAVEWLKERLR